MAFKRVPLGGLLGDKGYIRGPFGSALKRPELKKQGIPVYEQQHAINGVRDFRFFIDENKFKELKRFCVQLDDLIISCSGTLGRVSIIKEHDPIGIISQALLILRPDTKKITSQYLLYFLSSKEGFDELVAASHGSVQVNLAPRSTVEKIKIPLPEIDEQIKITGILNALDKKIELNQRMNDTLEGIAQVLFKSWFVDFDPVKAKVEGRKPEGMDDATATLFSSRFIDSPLGLIPEGWKSSSIGECFKLIMGQSPPGETYNEIKEGIAFYQGRTDFGWRFPMERIYCNAPTRFAERNDTLVSVRAPVGDVNVALDRCCIGRGVAALRHNSDASSFTYYTAQQLQAHFKNFDSEGTVFGSINKADFAKLPHIEPKDKVIQLYETIAGSLDKRIKTNEDQIRTLTEVRDNLLPRLISGKLRVAEVRETVEAVVS